MSTGRLAAVLAILVGCAPMPAEPSAPPPPPPSRAASPTAPAWSMLVAAPDLDGATLGAAPGATVAIVFASWCGHCRSLLDELAPLASRGDVRLVGVNFRHHEEYDARGDAHAVRAYVAAEAPWLRVVPAGEDLWRALGAPSKVPTVYVFRGDGTLAAVYDRRERPLPSLAEVDAVVTAQGSGAPGSAR